MEENKSALGNFFPNTTSFLYTSLGLGMMVWSFKGKDKIMKKQFFTIGCVLVGGGLIARAIGKRKEKK